MCIVIHHDDFKTADGEFIELHAVKRYFKVTEEGDQDLFFDDPGESQGQGEATLDPLPDIVGEVLNGQSEMNNTLEALCSIVDIDDDTMSQHPRTYLLLWMTQLATYQLTGVTMVFASAKGTI